MTNEVITPARKKIETKVITREEALASARIYFHEDELAATTWLNKYAMRDAQGNFLERTPDEMHKRMAAEFARIELKYAEQLTHTSEELLSTIA